MSENSFLLISLQAYFYTHTHLINTVYIYTLIYTLNKYRDVTHYLIASKHSIRAFSKRWFHIFFFIHVFVLKPHAYLYPETLELVLPATVQVPEIPTGTKKLQTSMPSTAESILNFCKLWDFRDLVFEMCIHLQLQELPSYVCGCNLHWCHCSLTVTHRLRKQHLHPADAKNVSHIYMFTHAAGSLSRISDR